MFTNPHNQNLLNDVMRVLSGETTETPIKPVPQWISEAAKKAAAEIKDVLSEGVVVTSESRRDILRKNLSEALDTCNCSVNTETSLQFEEEVRKLENQIAEGKQRSAGEILDMLEKSYKRNGLDSVLLGWKELGLSEPIRVGEALEDFKSIFEPKDQKSAAADIKSWLKPNDYNKYKKMMEGVEITLNDDEVELDEMVPGSKTDKRGNKSAASKLRKDRLAKIRKEKEDIKRAELVRILKAQGVLPTKKEEAEGINEMVDGLLEFVSKLSDEEVSVLRTIIDETN